MGLTIDPILEAEALSVQRKPEVGSGIMRWGYELRGPLLPAPGTREREWTLRTYRHNPYNTIFRAAAAGLIKRVQSTPWEIVAKDAGRWQQILMNADGGWDRLIARLGGDYLYHDSGAWPELIAPGNPRFAPDGPIVGLAVLDTLRVYPTGNPQYPAIYYDIYGGMHLMHRSRVAQLVDNEYTEEYLAGYGECALTRAIAPVRREILINQYIESFLDDKPMPGVRIWQNLGEPQVEAAFAQMERDRRSDDGGEWGRVLNLYALDTDKPADFKEYSNAKAPEGFDFDKYKNELVREIATCIGLDVQDIWELSGAGIGTGTQSEILAQKSRGKAFGNLLKRLERTINQALPERVEFRWQYKDPQEDKEEADKATAWASTITVLASYLSTDEIRQLAANQIGAMKDVLLDADGNLKRLDDDDPKPAETAIEDTDGSLRDTLENYVALPPSEPAAPATQPITQMLEAFTQRSFVGTGVDFERYFRAFARVGQAQNFPAAMMRATFREELYNAGTRAYEDGLREGGADPEAADAIERADRRRKVAEWLALQNDYINRLVDDINAGEIGPDALRTRSELWVSKSLRTIYYAGLNDAAGEELHRWVLGMTEKHCVTCLGLNGQVHRLKDYLRAGLVPGAQALECQGFYCDCELQKTTGRVTGRLPGTLSPWGSLADRLGGFLRRIGGKSTKSLNGTAILPVVQSPDLWQRYLMRQAGGR